MDSELIFESDYLINKVQKRLEDDIRMIRRAAFEESAGQIEMHARGILDALELMSVSLRGEQGREAYEEMRDSIRKYRERLAEEMAAAKARLSMQEDET